MPVTYTKNSTVGAQQNYKKFQATQMDDFISVIEKAKKTCENAGETISNHFADMSKMTGLAKGAQCEIPDIALTRYACY